MLTKITLNNFRSFRNAATIDLTKTNYTILPQNVADNGVLKGCIFVGANASGKSTVILGIKLLLDFLFMERDLNSSSYICMLGDDTRYSISYEFLIDNNTVKYSFEIDAGKSMISEKLILDGKLMLERMGQSAKSYIVEEKGVNYDETDVAKDALFLRTLYFNTRFASNDTLSKWMDFLKKSVYVNVFNKHIGNYGKNDVPLRQYLDQGGCDIINAFLDEYNFGQSIEYKHETGGGNFNFVVGTNENEKGIFFKRKDVEVPIPFEEESMGNQNLLQMLPSFLSVIKNGGMLLVDEFSSGFHNDLESLMVRYFMEKADKAQMLFVSHSTNLLSNTILRPDQEYSVEFNGAMGSSVKRFSSEQPRSAQNIEKMYVSGVFGGLPEYKEVTDEA